MLGGDFNSRIVARLRQKEGLSYGAGSGLTVDVFDRAGTFSASAIAAPENIEKLERAFREELALALEHGFRPDELKAAKAGLLQTRQIDRAEDYTLAATLRAYLFQGRTLDWDRALDERIERLTPADVLAAMRKHLDPTRLSVVKAGDFAKVQP
jgi:zinc protease